MKSPALFMLLLLLPLTVRADSPVDYATQIKPILQARCFSCHGALKQEAALRLDTGELLRKGGDSGATVVAGDPQKSLLVERISDADDSLRMPPEGKPLTADEIDLFRRWISEGAKSPAKEQPEADPREHWAFQKPTRNVPSQAAENPWVRNPIDAFIAARHAERGVTPLPPAKKHLLLRRVYLDLIGLPPTRDELRAFLQDDSSDAYEAVVDRLLSSRHYGERWGRHWMDVWRYSDWYGRRNVNDVRNSYPHIWRWRDWIIESLNEDKGYDQMIREMLAADELYPDDDSRMPALGFIVRNWFSLNYDTWKQDLVEHTGKAFLGLRLNCAHCHDHKYDPISQEEYFRFRAFFEPLELRHDRVPGGPALTKYIRYQPGSGGSLRPIEAGLARVYDHYHDEKTFMYRLGDTRDRMDRDPVTPAAPAILGGDTLQVESVTLPPVAWYPGLKKFVIHQEREAAQQVVEKAEQELASAAKLLRETRQALADAEAKLEAAKAASENASPIEPVGRDSADVIAHWRFEGTDSFLSDSSGHGHTLRHVSEDGTRVSQAELPPAGLSRRFDLASVADNRIAAEFQQSGGFSLLAADGDASFFANEFSFECLLHCDVSQRNFNRTIVDYPGSWMLLHRGLNESQFELRVRYASEAGQIRDVCSGGTPHPELPPVETESPPLVLQTGRDYYICLVMGTADVSLHVADLSTRSALQSFEFPRSGPVADGKGDAGFSRLRRPESITPLNLGNSDGTGQFDGLLDEIRLTRRALTIEQIAAVVGQPASEAMRAATIEVAGLKQKAELGTRGTVAAEAVLAAAQTQLASVKSRLDADAARFVEQRSEAETAPLIQATVTAEYHAKLAAAKSKLAAAESVLAGQRQSAKPDASAIKTAEATVKTETANIDKLTKAGVPTSGEYTAFAPTYPKESTGRRTALARWMTSSENPLTARVAVNHIWMRHFGRPLVESVFDFGRGGKQPSHPELLDWLAVELMNSPDEGASGADADSGAWRMKYIHRLIVTSNTYRLSSRPGPAHPNAELDPDNSTYWKFDQRRLEAETIRDAMLSVSGQLDPAIGGQDLDPQLEATSRRRSMYFSVYPEGGGMMRFLTLFDAPDPCDCYRRSESLVPQQALGMSNSVMALNLGRLLTGKLSEQLPEASGPEFVTAAYETILSRRPTDAESLACQEFLKTQSTLFESPGLVLPATSGKSLVSAATGPQRRAREGLVRVLLNHHEFVTVH